jgi:hypothetical protein
VQRLFFIMSRSRSFHSDREPLQHDSTLQLDEDKVRGALSFLNPTHARFTPASLDSVLEDARRPGDTPTSNVEFKWTSRNNRKGRHALLVHQSEGDQGKYASPPPTSGMKELFKGIRRMLTYFPIWDVSYLVATTFTLGSVVWVLNSFFAFLPFTNPKSLSDGEVLWGGGITAFVGATIFEIGSILLMFEAVNENRAGCFGWALERLYDGLHSGNSNEDDTGAVGFTPTKDGCTHHHQNRSNLVGKSPMRTLTNISEKSIARGRINSSPDGTRSWVWFPTWYELHTHYFHDLGFLACSSQTIGATVFWVSGFTALPPIYNSLEATGNLNGAFWIPQVIGGIGFVISGALFTIETQKHCWQPAPSVLGWHIGMWNFVGGIGFTLCPIFGLLGSKNWMLYQSSCSTFWGKSKKPISGI